MISKAYETSPRSEYGAITKFLIFCAGADGRLLQQCPNSDLVKIQGIGGVVAATGILAFFSGSYAFYTVFSPKEPLIANVESAITGASALATLGAILFGLVWALVIFNLDRFIVAASGPGDGTDNITAKEIVNALPRLLMAVFIGLVLAKPLEIKIMETEIEAALSDTQQRKYDEYRAATDRRFSEERQRLDAERTRVLDELKSKEAGIARLEAELSDATARYQREVQGEGGSSRGDGPIAARLRLVVQGIEARLAAEKSSLGPQVASLKLEADELQRRIDAMLVEKQRAYEVDMQNAQRDDGLMRRIQIAHEVSPWASNLLTALLIIIEVAPIIFKLMLIAGPYEYYLENEKRLAFARRGIDVVGEITPGTSSQRVQILQVKYARYAEAEALSAREVRKFQVETTLTDVAMQAHEQRVADEIRANPERFVQGESTKTQA